MSEKKPQYEKMSKSKGNVIRPEEVVYGVCDLDSNYEFRNLSGEVVDWEELGVWRDALRTQCYFSSTRTGRIPVFLCEKVPPDTPVEEIKPCVLAINGQEIVQHENFVNGTATPLFYAYRYLE